MNYRDYAIELNIDGNYKHRAKKMEFSSADVNSSKFIMSVKNKTNPFNLSGYEVFLIIKREDDAHILVKSEVLDEENGRCQCVLPNSAVAMGNSEYTAELRLQNHEGTIVTKPFNYSTFESLNEDLVQDIATGDDFHVLKETIQELKDIKDTWEIVKSQAIEDGFSLDNNSQDLLDCLGSEWHDFIGQPPVLEGKDGDYSLDIITGDVFKKSLNVWQRIGNIKGLKGDKGDRGITGLTGATGARGQQGERGEKGEIGQTGVEGTEWHDGIGAPPNNLGKNKDYYLDMKTSDVYKKIGGSWSREGSLREMSFSEFYTKSEVDTLFTKKTDKIDYESLVNKPTNLATIEIVDAKIMESDIYTDGKISDHELNLDIHTSAEERSKWNDKAEKTVASATNDGLMSNLDKRKLNFIEDNANNYTHPSTHDASIIVEDSNRRFVSDDEKQNWNGKETIQGSQEKVDTAIENLKTYTDSELGKKSNSNHNHDSKYADKIATISHILTDEIHITGSERTAWNNKSDKSYVDSELAKKATTSQHNSHVGNDDIHVTASDKTNWNGKSDKSYVDAELGKKADRTLVDSHTSNSTMHVTQADKNNWSAKVEKSYVDNHTNNANAHVSNRDRESWDAKETVQGSQSKATKALDDAKSYTNSQTKNLASITDVENKLSELIDQAPSTLDTLNELANALGNDPNFATTVSAQIGTKADKVFVDNELVKLAPKTTVYTKAETDSRLGVKSDKSYVDGELANKATKQELDTHSGDNVKHITQSERTNWNDKETVAGAQAKATKALDDAKSFASTELSKKSDTTFVTAELAKKSDKSYVDGEVAKLAPKSSVYTKSETDTELAKKATVTTVNTKADKTFVDAEIVKLSPKTVVDSHISDSVKHITSQERTDWNNTKGEVSKQTNILFGENTLSHNSKVNGFSQIGVKGQTLVNLHDHTVTWALGGDKTGANCVQQVTMFKPNTVYTCVWKKSQNIKKLLFLDLSPTESESNVFKFTTNETFSSNYKPHIYNKGTLLTQEDVDSVKIVIIEGDHTSKPISYFEGLKSVAQPTNKVEVLLVGENLFDGVMELGSINQTNGNSEVNLNSTRTPFIRVEENTPYTTSINGVVKNTNIFYYDKNKNFISYGLVYSTFTTPFDCKYTRHFYSGSDLTVKFSLTKGNTPKPYKPYQSNKTSLLLTEPLRSLPNGVADEVQGDKVIRRCGEYQFKGSEDFNSVANATEHKSAWCNLPNIKPNQKKPNPMYCDKFKTNDGILDGEGIYVDSGKLFVLTITNAKLPTQDLNGIKTLLKQWYDEGKPLTVVYELATPIIEPIVNQSIPYFEGGHIFTDGGAIPTPISIEVGDTLKSQVESVVEKISHDKVISEMEGTQKLTNFGSFETGLGNEIDVRSEVENGFSSVGIEGRTLVNLADFTLDGSSSTLIYRHINKKKEMFTNKSYTLFNPTNKKISYVVHKKSDDTEIKNVFVNQNDSSLYTLEVDQYFKSVVGRISDGWLTTDTLNGKHIILEGDHTSHSQSYFEGLKSVGQQADGSPPKIEILSCNMKDSKHKDYLSNKTEISVEPLRKISDTVKDVMVGDKIVRKCGEVKLNGSENWNINATQTNTIHFQLNVIDSTLKNHNNGTSDKFVVKSIYENDHEGVALEGNTNKLRISILKSKLSTQDVQGFKTWLQANPVTVVYELATPTVETINSNNIGLYKNGHVFVNSGAIESTNTHEVVLTKKSQMDNLYDMLVKALPLVNNVPVTHDIETLPFLPSEEDIPTTLPFEEDKAVTLPSQIK